MRSCMMRMRYLTLQHNIIIASIGPLMMMVLGLFAIILNTGLISSRLSKGIQCRVQCACYNSLCGFAWM